MMVPKEGVTPLENKIAYSDQNLASLNQFLIFNGTRIMSKIKYDVINKLQVISTTKMGVSI